MAIAGECRIEFPARTTYTDPPIAQVGIAEEESADDGKRPLGGSTFYASRSASDRESRDLRPDEGLRRCQTKRVLGAMIFGVGGNEAIHFVLNIMYADKPYTTITNAVHFHPTVSELILACQAAQNWTLRANRIDRTSSIW